MENLTIREILDSVYRGQIRIPAFQRGFVWDPDRVAFLIDSIYKGYPFGSLLFWRTSERLRTENKLGPFDLPAPQADFPIDYVLDGQQRATSIFGVFQTELQGDSPTWEDIFFDFQQVADVQETQFFALAPDEVDPNRHFPLRAIFDTTEYRRLTRPMNDELALKIDAMQTVFREARIPVQTFRTDEKEKVAIIFERINRQGIPLDTLQLLSAWTWSEDFQLQSQFEDLISELSDYGFTELSNDISLLLRCTAAILTGSSRPESLVQLNGAAVRQRFNEVVNGIRGALDFLANTFNLPSIENLPFENALIPLSVFFAAPGNAEVAVSNRQRNSLSQWFWRSAFSGRYSAGVLRHLDADIAEVRNLRVGLPSRLTEVQVNIGTNFFLENRFLIGSVHTKTFIALLAQTGPMNFVSGTPVNLRQKLQHYNRKEFHHLMPKAFLVWSNQVHRGENILANFCFIARSDNRALGGDAPSRYRVRMPENIEQILQSHLCPPELFDDDYETFVTLRAAMLAAKANELCGVEALLPHVGEAGVVGAAIGPNNRRA
jgi:hypothetical protein